MRTGSWMARIAFSAALICASALAAWCQELPAADPAALVFSAERLARLGTSLEDDVKAGRIPGAVVLVARHGKVAYFEAFGQQNHESGAPMRKDSIFRIYSMTKPIVSVALMTLWEEGRFDLDDPISKYLPEFSNIQVARVQKDASGKPSVVLEPARRAPTIQQLLTHTGGLSYDILPKSPDYPVRQMYVDSGIPNPEDSLAEMVAKIARLPLAYQPGTVWEYSRSTDVLARLVEVVSEGQAPAPGTVGDYGWGGTAGTIFWVDPKEDLTAVLMVQPIGIVGHYVQLIRTLVYQALN